MLRVENFPVGIESTTEPVMMTTIKAISNKKSSSLFRGTALPLAVVAALSTLAGCGGPGTGEVQQATSHLAILSGYYGLFTTENGQRPADEAAFKAFVKEKTTPPVLERYDVSSADELFLSKRDGQPLVFLYGKQPKGVDRDVVGYEQTGFDGKRWVVFSLGNIEDVDDARLRELVPTAQ